MLLFKNKWGLLNKKMPCSRWNYQRSGQTIIHWHCLVKVHFVVSGVLNIWEPCWMLISPCELVKWQFPNSLLHTVSFLAIWPIIVLSDWICFHYYCILRILKLKLMLVLGIYQNLASRTANTADHDQTALMERSDLDQHYLLMNIFLNTLWHYGNVTIWWKRWDTPVIDPEVNEPENIVSGY